jgi:hypothetical protein
MLLQPSYRIAVPRLSQFFRSTRRWTHSTPLVKISDPLRILFCGSDAFSIPSLRQLVQLKENDANGIHSIDVLCRTDKRVGRGLKEIRQRMLLLPGNHED